MALITRLYVLSGPGSTFTANRVPSAVILERYETPTLTLQYDDTDPGTLTDLDTMMGMVGFQPSNGEQSVNLFARASGLDPVAAAGRAQVYSKTELGITNAFVRTSDGVVTRLTPLTPGPTGPTLLPDRLVKLSGAPLPSASA